MACFKPSSLHLLGIGLSRKTLRLHRDNLWALGGQIIRQLHEDPPLRQRHIDELLVTMVDEEGGPLIGGQLQAVFTSGGAPVTLGDDVATPWGASWGAVDMILGSAENEQPPDQQRAAQAPREARFLWTQLHRHRRESTLTALSTRTFI